MPLEQKVWRLLRNLSDQARQEALKLINLAGRIGLVGGGYVFKKLSLEQLDGLSGIATEELAALRLVRKELVKTLYSLTPFDARKAVEEYGTVTRALGVESVAERELQEGVERILAEAGISLAKVTYASRLCGSCMHSFDDHYANGRCQLCTCLMFET